MLSLTNLSVCAIIAHDDGYGPGTHFSEPFTQKGSCFSAPGCPIRTASAQQGGWEAELQTPPACGTLAWHGPNGFGCQPALLALNIPKQGRD